MIDPIQIQILEPDELAAALKQIIGRLGQVGQFGIDALVERLASPQDTLEFGAGVDLLGLWIGSAETD